MERGNDWLVLRPGLLHGACGMYGVWLMLDWSGRGGLATLESVWSCVLLVFVLVLGSFRLLVVVFGM